MARLSAAIEHPKLKGVMASKGKHTIAMGKIPKIKPVKPYAPMKPLKAKR